MSKETYFHKKRIYETDLKKHGKRPIKRDLQWDEENLIKEQPASSYQKKHIYSREKKHIYSREKNLWMRATKMGKHL